LFRRAFGRRLQHGRRPGKVRNAVLRLLGDERVLALLEVGGKLYRLLDLLEVEPLRICILEIVVLGLLGNALKLRDAPNVAVLVELRPDVVVCRRFLRMRLAELLYLDICLSRENLY
jgi:hypothetical protein